MALGELASDNQSTEVPKCIQGVDRGLQVHFDEWHRKVCRNWYKGTRGGQAFDEWSAQLNELE
jgi:hypothetical protein